MIELPTVKEHCRVDDDFSDDDNLLKIYTGAAKRHVEKWTRRKLYQLNTDPGFETDEDRLLLDDDIRAAMLLLIGHWYSNREAVVIGQATSEVPFAVEALLQPYRIYGV
ncbi:head-tail connector protein [Winslowiella arboricola]|uniref:head-tail connector protein n=1 Tax=Winslowiella arboricola TaxID=2978220 RepID=UPI00225DE260|nr:head-tail connector protein [Winslowiella arboricola]MCU5775226.1 head-tail connector protein [Winslowiella arboricola]